MLKVRGKVYTVPLYKDAVKDTGGKRHSRIVRVPARLLYPVFDFFCQRWDSQRKIGINKLHSLLADGKFNHGRAGATSTSFNGSFTKNWPVFPGETVPRIKRPRSGFSPCLCVFQLPFFPPKPFYHRHQVSGMKSYYHSKIYLSSIWTS